jgi:hypothetical protein
MHGYPETTPQGCDKFPGPMPVGDVTQDWVEDVADCVMTAVQEASRAALHVAPIRRECRGGVGNTEEFCATGAT